MESLFLCLYKVTPYVSVDFSWEMGGGEEFDSSLPLGLNNRKISNYPIDNYSLHISPRAQKAAGSRKTRLRARRTCKPLSTWRQAGPRQPHWLREAGWALASSRGWPRLPACHKLQLTHRKPRETSLPPSKTSQIKAPGCILATNPSLITWDKLTSPTRKAPHPIQSPSCP